MRQVNAGVVQDENQQPADTKVKWTAEGDYSIKALQGKEEKVIEICN